MAFYFDRKLKIKIGRDYERMESTLVDQSFRVSFSAVLSNDDTSNETFIEIYNLKESTRRKILDQGDLVTIEAGYADESLGVVSIAKIRPLDGLRIKREPPDVITVIEALDGIKNLVNRNIALSFGAGFSFREALSIVAREAGLSLRVVQGLTIRDSFRQSTTYINSIKNIISEIMKRAVVVQTTPQGERFVQAKHTYQAGELIVFLEGQPVDFNIQVISPESGLLYSPQYTVNETESGQREVGYTIVTLLNPNLKPGSRIRLKSRDVEGIFVVKRVWHRGDTFGNEWTSICDLIESV